MWTSHSHSWPWSASTRASNTWIKPGINHISGLSPQESGFWWCLNVFDGFCDSPNLQKSWGAMIFNILQPTLLSSYIKPCAHGKLLPQIATRELKLSFPQQSCSRYSSRLDVWCGSLKSTTRFTTNLWPKISLRYAIQWAKWWSTTVLMIQFWDKPELFQARSAGKKMIHYDTLQLYGFPFPIYTCSLQPITIQESDILTVSLLTSSDQALSFE